MTDIEIIPTPRVMLSITDAARCLSVGRSTMYELINSGARCRREQRAQEP